MSGGPAPAVPPHKLPPSEISPLPSSTPIPLARSLGVAGVLFLTLSAGTPASSLFVIVPGMLQAAGTGTLWAFLLAGLVCIGTAFIYAELASAFPVAGGEYVMVARTIGPLAGFVVLGINVFNNILFLPVIGLGLSAVLATVVPGLPEVPVAIAVVAGATLCAILDIRTNAVVTGLFLALEVAALAAVTALGLVHPVRGLGPMLAHPMAAAGAGLAPASFAAIGTAATVAIFALNGYGMAVYFGEEMHAPAARIGRVILASFALTFALELLPIAAVLAGTPDLAATLRAADPFGGFVAARGGGPLGGAVAIGVAIAIVNAAIVTVLAAARFLYATARDRVWGHPFDRGLGRVASRRGSPWVATLLIGAIGIGGCFVDLPFLLVLNGGGLIVTYAAISLAALAGRRSGATAHARYRMPLFPLAPLVTLAALALVVWADWLDPGEGRAGIVVTLVQMGAAALYYRFVLRRRGAWAVHDPPGA